MITQVKKVAGYQTEQPSKPALKLYEKPQVVYRGPLEAMAAVCAGGIIDGKTSPPAGGCVQVGS